MNNPLDTDSFKHYLIFTSLGRTDLYQIAEPVGFDGANFVKEQEGKRYARTREYGAIDKLTFVDCETIDIGVEQVINPQGDVSTLLNHGLQWLLSIYNDYGFEAKVEYILEKNGVQFSGGVLDFTEKDLTDGYTYITCKLIQKNKVANFKRRFDGKFNLFSDKNALQEAITPVDSIKFLRKATPVTKLSNWDRATDFPDGFTIQSSYFMCFSRNIVNSEINATLTSSCDVLFDTFGTQRAMTWDQHITGGTEFINVADGTYMKLAKAKRLLQKVSVKLKIKGSAQWHFPSPSGVGRLFYFVMLADEGIFHSTFYGGDYTEVWGIDIDTSGITNFDEEITIDIPFDVPIGRTMYGAFTASGLKSLDIHVDTAEVTVTGNETAIDTVIEGVRWIDGIKQASLYSCGIEVDAELYEVGGTHYNNILFNKAGVSQKTDIFTVTPKALFESIEEVNCDYEPDENKIFIGHQKDFYKNDEIGVFDILADDSFTISENERCMINKFTDKYNTFEQNRTTEGTDIAIHTDAEFTFLNEQVENVKEIALELVRDPLSHQVMVNLEITQPTTSTTDDDKINIVEITDLSDGSFNIFGAHLAMRIVDGNVELLNRDLEGDATDVVINWLILGFTVGADFEIIYGDNIGVYTVSQMTNSVLTLTPIGFTPTFVGNSFIKIKYYYNDVSFVTRTNEGFIFNPLKLQNARYSIKRNMVTWFGEYFSSCLIYSKKDIINAYFKSNGAFSSQLDTEVLPLVENATILYDSLPNPLITSKIYNITTVAEFQDVLDYMEAYKTSRGFVRCLDSNGRVLKGYVQKLDHLWAENKLKLVLEEKFETQYLILTYDDGLLTVNDAQYNLSGVEHWWRFDNDLIKLYDEKNRPLCNYYKYNLVNLNGYTFESKEQLLIALLAL